MSADLPAKTIVDFIVGDFESTWESLAANFAAMNRANFMFGLSATILLELASRLCGSDSSGRALADFSKELKKRDSRYFTRLPVPCSSPSSEFRLPHVGPDCENQLLSAVFDLVRNGQAHQYQQIRVRLSDGADFQVQLTGAEYGASLGNLSDVASRQGHLSLSRNASGDLWLKVRTDVLFVDIRDSIRDARLLVRGLTLKYLERPRGRRGGWVLSASDLEAALRGAGH